MRVIGQVSDLYLRIYLSLKNFLILIVTIIIIAAVSYYNLGLGFDTSEFMFIKDDYIQNYLESSSSFLMILNCVIIPTLFLSELKEEVNTMNYILIPRVSKLKLNFAKLLTALMITVYYCILEMLIVGIVPLIWYPSFVLELTFLKIALFIILYSCFNVLLLLVMTKLFRSFVVVSIPLIVYLILSFIKDNIKIRRYFPILVISSQSLEANLPINISLFLIFFLSMIYISSKN